MSDPKAKAPAVENDTPEARPESPRPMEEDVTANDDARNATRLPVKKARKRRPRFVL